MKLRYLLTISALTLVGSSVKADMASDIVEIREGVSFLVAEKKLDIREKERQKEDAEQILANRIKMAEEFNRRR